MEDGRSTGGDLRRVPGSEIAKAVAIPGERQPGQRQDGLGLPPDVGEALVATDKVEEGRRIPVGRAVGARALAPLLIVDQVLAGTASPHSAASICSRASSSRVASRSAFRSACSS